MSALRSVLATPWKVRVELSRWLILPYVRLLFAVNGVSWGRDWRLHGAPILLKHRRSRMEFGDSLGLRSSNRSNPLGLTHSVVLCTWLEEAALEVGARFRMSGGALCAVERITIGNRVTVGANSTIIDSDFHPVDYRRRLQDPQGGESAPVRIDDGVFIGMNCLILKGVHIGREAVVGAGSVVTHDVPSGAVVAGNPAAVVSRRQ